MSITDTRLRAEAIASHGFRRILTDTVQPEPVAVVGFGLPSKDRDELARLFTRAPALIAACEAAEYWLTEEQANPGTARPDEILRVLRNALGHTRSIGLDTVPAEPVSPEPGGPATMTGDELKAIRKGLGLTTLEFGRALGYQGNANTVSVQVRQMETDMKPVKPWIARLADMYRRHGVPAGWTDPTPEGADPAP